VSEEAEPAVFAEARDIWLAVASAKEMNRVEARDSYVKSQSPRQPEYRYLWVEY
jgi:hypothetical protein